MKLLLGVSGEFWVQSEAELPHRHGSGNPLLASLQIAFNSTLAVSGPAVKVKICFTFCLAAEGTSLYQLGIRYRAREKTHLEVRHEFAVNWNYCKNDIIHRSNQILTQTQLRHTPNNLQQVLMTWFTEWSVLLCSHRLNLCIWGSSKWVYLLECQLQSITDSLSLCVLMVWISSFSS